MIALEKLAMARKQGAKPSAVMLTLYPAKQPQWWRDGTVVEIVADSSIVRADFRPLVGCHVIIIADERGDTLRRVVEKACQQAQSVTVLSSIDPDDLGHVWEREKGWRRFGDRPLLEVA